MATATMATAAGAAALLYYTLNRKLETASPGGDDDESGSGLPNQAPLGIHRVSNRLIRAPATWLETISTLSETLRFTYSETLGKWPIGDLAFGISFLLKRQGNLLVDGVFGGVDSQQLKGPEIVAELKYLLNLLTLCWHFSKKPFPLFLEETGFSEENVLLQEPKAGILKPAFTILVDHNQKCFLLLIRGTHSIKDTLTAATGAVVPFHHSVVHEGGVSDLVLGYAHCGMVAAARWIAKLAKPCLLEALDHYPGYELKIVGHSLGGGTAALLTYILREQKELSATTCVTFAPAACMTWELAESGTDFITSVVNGADLVPTFSAASVDDLRAEVTASAWLNDLRNQIEQTRILSTVYRSASALSSRLPSIATAKATVAGAGAILRPVSNGTQVVMRRAQSVAAWARPNLRLSSWSCMAPRQRTSAARSNSNDEGSSPESSSSHTQTSEPLLTSSKTRTSSTVIEALDLPVSTSVRMEWTSEIECSISDGGMHQDTNGDVSNEGEDLMDHDRHKDRMTEVELWQQLEHELYDRTEGEEADVANEIREEEEAAAARREEEEAAAARREEEEAAAARREEEEASAARREEEEASAAIREEEEEAAIAEVSEGQPESSSPEMKEEHRFFPAGKIMHIVTLHSSDANCEGGSPSSSGSDEQQQQQPEETRIGIFLTPRSLYSKLRLSQTMISDHFMPVYRRRIEKLIKEFEKEAASVGEVVL